MSILDTAYYGREQTAVKHAMLRKYLGPAARIIGSFADCFVYVDCCSGPWNAATDDLSDTSFSIAIKELCAARSFLREKGRPVEFRCLFIEEQHAPFKQLQDFCNSIDEIEVKAVEGDFSEKVDEIFSFIRAKRNSFPFFFIDPTGWTPIALTKIAPLLRYRPSEVLINFMTSHIKRFLESANFEAMFGPDYMRKVMGLAGQERDDLAAYSFADEIRKFYPHTCTSVVLNPSRQQAHFHLIYGTRHPKGVEKFKEAERACFGFMEAVRLDAQRRKDAEHPQQMLFEVRPEKDAYVQQLRDCYREQALTSVEQSLARSEEQAWEIASRFPLVWKSDVYEWLREGAVRLRSRGAGTGA